MLSSTSSFNPSMDIVPNVPKLKSRKSTSGAGSQNQYWTGSIDQDYAHNTALLSANSRFDEAYTPPSQRYQYQRSTSQITESNGSTSSDRQSSRSFSRPGKSSPYAASNSVGKKKGRFLSSLLTSKEPSMAAFAQMEAQMKASQSKDPNQRLNPLGMPGISSATLPTFVPKVNSKWDGVPRAVKERKKEIAKQGKQGEDCSSNSSSIHSRRVSRSNRHPERRPISNSTLVNRDSQDQSLSSGVSSIIDFEIANLSKEISRRSFSLRASSSESLPDVASLLPKDIPPPPAIPEKYRTPRDELGSLQNFTGRSAQSDSGSNIRGLQKNAHANVASAPPSANLEQFHSAAAMSKELGQIPNYFVVSSRQEYMEDLELTKSKPSRLLPFQETSKDVPEHSHSPLPTPTDSFPPTPHSLVHPTLDEAEAFLVSGTSFLPAPPIPPRSIARNSPINNSYAENPPSQPEPPLLYDPHGFLAGEAQPLEIDPYNTTNDSSGVAKVIPETFSSLDQNEAPVLSEELRVTQNDIECRPDSSRKRLGLTPTFTKATGTAPWNDADSMLDRPTTPKAPSRFSLLGRAKANPV